MLSLFVLTPLLLLFIINAPFKFRREKAAFWLIGGLLIAQALLVMLHPVWPWSACPDPFGPFFAFELSLDGLSLIALFTIGVIVFVSLLVARSMISRENEKFNFVNLIIISLVGMNATVLTRDIFSLYVFIEVTAVATFVLISLEKDKFAIEGTFKYLVLSMIATVFMLSSIAFFILAAGSTSFSAIYGAFSAASDKFLLNFAAGLFLCGLLIKAGAVPFHGWVPDAYSDAPAPVAILLAGVVTKICGVYALLRLSASVFILSASLRNALLVIGALSIIVAALAAFAQKEMRRMLSYSSISQIGYIVLALGCGTPLAFVGAVFHFFNHAVFKSLLFVNSASLEKKFGSTDIVVMTGMGDSLPVTSATSLLGMLSTAGIPPLSGFWSKLIIILALFSSGKFVYALIALLGSILTLAYFLSLEREVFFVKAQTILKDKAGVPFGIVFSEILLAAITVGAGLGFPYILNVWMMPLGQMFH